MLATGTLAPEIQLPDLNGHPWNLSQALKNGPVILAFFKVSCPTCQLTFPFLQRLADASPSALLMAVSQDDAAATREFQARFGVAMPTLLDTPRIYPASNAYQITSVPSLFAVEPGGKISFGPWKASARPRLRRSANVLAVRPSRSKPTAFRRSALAEDRKTELP